MANVAVTSDAWTEISITSGTVQNISATADIELSAEQTDNSGVVLKPSEIYQWDNETIYARAVTEDKGALRVVNFKKAAGGGGGYVLPVASASTLGGVKVGNNLSIDASGVLSATGGGGGYVLPPATASTLGGVKIGDNVTVDANGEISVAAPYFLPKAAAGTLGGVKIGSNVNVDGDGVISVAAPYTLPTAAADTLGGVKIGDNITIDANGAISATAAYTLPPATASTLGGVIVGDNISVDANGEISTHAPYSLPAATSSTLGGVIVGDNISVDANGEISTHAPYTLPTATANDLGGVKIGNNITIDGNGAISAPAAYTLPTAAANTLGGIKIGQNLFIDADTGVLSAATPSTDPVGRVVYDVILRTGYIKANGATVADASTAVPNLLQFVQNNPSLLAANQAAYDANVGLYLYDSGTDELTLPNYTDRYIAGAASVTALDAKIGTHAHVYQSFGGTSSSNVEGVKNIMGDDNWPPGSANVTLDSEFSANWSCGANTASASTTVASGISSLSKTGHTIYDDSSGTTRPKTITMIPQIKY